MIWINIVPHIPKNARYTISARIENKFLDLLELAYATYFSKKENKAQKITECILILDTLKFIISTAWEAKYISHQQYEKLALNLDEVGKMFGGWKNIFDKQKKTADHSGRGKEMTGGSGKQTDCSNSTCCRA